MRCVFYTKFLIRFTVCIAGENSSGIGNEEERRFEACRKMEKRSEKLLVMHDVKK